MSIRVAASSETMQISGNEASLFPATVETGGAKGKAFVSSLFPTTNNTSGYRPPVPTSPRHGQGGTLAAPLVPLVGSSGDGYRPTSLSSNGASTPRGLGAGLGLGGGALSASSCGPRSGPSMIMTKVDLLSDPNAAYTIANIKEAAASMASWGTGGSSATSSYHKTATMNDPHAVPSSSSASFAPPPPPAVNLQNGIHIIIPAPPPSWSGGGAPSSVIQRNFLTSAARASGDGASSTGAGVEGGGLTPRRRVINSMVSVTESPYYTHQSLKEAQKRSEEKLSEVTLKHLKRGGGNAAHVGGEGSSALMQTSGSGSSGQVSPRSTVPKMNAIQSSIPSGRSAAANSSDKFVVIVPLSTSDVNQPQLSISSSHDANAHSTSPNTTTATSPTLKSSLAPVGTTTIRPIPTDQRLGAPIVNVQGKEASQQNQKSVYGVAVVEVGGSSSPGTNATGDSLVDQRPGLVLPAHAEERYRSETLVAEAVRQAEASAHIFIDPSYHLGASNRRPKKEGKDKNDTDESTPAKQGQALPMPPALLTYVPNTTIGVGEDFGRDRILASSIRFGYHSEELQKLATESQQRVGFAIAMAPALGASTSSPQSDTPHAGGALIPAPPPVMSQSARAATFKGGERSKHYGSAKAGEGEAASSSAPSSPVAFGITTPRFGPHSIAPYYDIDPPSVRPVDGAGKKKNKSKKYERAPPVGHYNIKYTRTETIATRNIFFSGHGVPYEKQQHHHKASPTTSPRKPHHDNKDHENLAASGIDSNSVSFRHMSPSERREAEAKKAAEASEKALEKLSARERARLKVAEDEVKQAAKVKNSAPFMSALPRLQTSPRRDAEIVQASAIGTTPYGEFNEAIRSQSPRTKCAVDMGKSGGGRDAIFGLAWNRSGDDPHKRTPIRETNYTGELFGDKRDTTAYPRGYVDMERQVARGLPMHSHQALQQATGGSQLLPGQSAPLNSLDLQERPEGNMSATNKYRNTLGNTNTTNTLAKMSPRKFIVKPANNVTSDERPDMLGVQFIGSSATKGPKSPVAFSKQTSRPDPSFKSSCAVETYDTEYLNPDGTIASSLQVKNDTTSPRTQQTLFNRMGSHNDYNSYAQAAERARQHDADVGISDSALQSGFVQTRPRTLRNVDFTHLAPRKDDTKILTESCADSDKIYPKHMLHERVSGDPRMTTHTSRETAKKASSMKPARTTDTFYDVPKYVSYSGDKCKPPSNAVDIAMNTGRDAHSPSRGDAKGSPRTSMSSSLPQENGGVSPLRGGRHGEATVNLGPGQYDFNVEILSKPLPAVSFRK